MKWSITNEHNHNPKLCGLRQCKLPYTACIENIFPPTPTFHLEEINDIGDLNFRGWDENPPIPITVDNIDNQRYTEQTNIGTQQTGRGDSGSGHWMYNNEVAVLVGITTSGKAAGGPSMIQKTTNSS